MGFFWWMKKVVVFIFFRVLEVPKKIQKVRIHIEYLTKFFTKVSDFSNFPEIIT